MHDWQNFYMLTGTAAATLIGLLFVAISIGTHLTLKQATISIHTFVNPILLYYVQVLLISCMAVMPLQSAIIFAGVPGILGCFNVFLALKVCWRMLVLHRAEALDLGHWIWHFLLPLVAGALFVYTGGSLFWHETSTSLILAVATLLCLTIGLRNSWVLTVWLVLHQNQAENNPQTDEVASA